jgi:hypothetical protein
LGVHKSLSFIERIADTISRDTQKVKCALMMSVLLCAR